MQDAPKAVWSIAYVSLAFFPSLKQNYIAYRSSKVSDCIFEINQLWQPRFIGVFELENIQIGQSCHKIYSNNRVNFQVSTPILNANTKKSGNSLNAPPIYMTTTTSSKIIVVFDKKTATEIIMPLSGST